LVNPRRYRIIGDDGGGMGPGAPARAERRLAAILAADVAGHSRLIEADEEGTLARLRVLRGEVIDPKIAGNMGRLVKTTGDGLLVEFGSVVDALRCAVEVQREMATRNEGVPPDNRIELRIGVNVGDIRWLFVIARNSSFTYKGQAIDVKQVGRELGVRYVLEGSVRKAGSRVRITGQLIDATSGAHLWADHFDGSLEDVFDLQDKVAIRVAGIIEPALRQAEIERARRKRPDSLDAYDLYLRAVATYYPVTRVRVFEALALLRRAIAIDPHYRLALSWAAICHLALVRDGWAEDFEISRRTACDLARQAIEAAENDPAIYANAANVLAYFGEDIGAMIALVDRALALNPSFARGWNVSGLLRSWAGEPDLAIEHIETGLRLSPRERLGQPLSAIGSAHFLKRRFDEAASKLILSIHDHPGFPPSYRTLAACYAHMGRLDDARRIIEQLRAITPMVVPSDLPFRNPEDRELYLSGLRLAVGETT
jgi:adenylate cyclase